MKAYKVSVYATYENEYGVEKEQLCNYWFEILSEVEAKQKETSERVWDSDSDSVSLPYEDCKIRYKLEEFGEAFRMCSVYEDELILTGDDEPSTGNWLCEDMSILDDNGQHQGTVDVEKTIKYYVESGLNSQYEEDPRKWDFNCWGFSLWTNSGWELISREV